MHYRERVSPPLPVLLLTGVLVGSFGLILVPLSGELAAAVGLTLAILTGLVQYLTSPIVEIDGEWFRAGTARIEGEYLGRVEVLDRTEVRKLMGTGADARAYVSHRDYAKGAVRVELRDPRDPAPYWLVSSGRAAELARALEAIAG
ncbi:MAG TPA: DUF3093 domain-containing protein [Actinomycetaceae bacterium]|nr:DUF3093 domain-containing protein [Actinomycetaceae bacterium]